MALEAASKFLRTGWLRRRLGALLLATAVGATALAHLYLSDALLLNPDSIQLISTASNLLAGKGLSSSIVYYDSQYDTGVMPTPQTVWPPGLVWLLAAAKILGLNFVYTLFGIAIVCTGLVAIAVYATSRLCEVPPLISLAAALMWLILPSAWYVAIGGFSEPLFILATLVSGFAVVRWARTGRNGLRWPLVAGLAAAIAVLVRYSGVFWISAVGVWFVLEIVRAPTWRTLRAALAFGSLPVSTVFALIARNYALTGRLSGGQFDHYDPISLLDAARAMYWELGPMLGMDAAHVPKLVFVVLATLIFSIAVATYLRLLRSTSRSPALDATRASLELSAIYGGILFAFLLVSAVRVSWIVISYRYALPFLPFLFLIMAVCAGQIWVRMVQPSAAAKRTVRLAALAVLATPLLGYPVGLVSDWPPLARHPASSVVRSGLAQQSTEGRTVARILEDRVNPNSALLAHQEHRVGHATGLPTYGLMNARFTHKIWTSAEVLSLIQDRNIGTVLFFPTVYDPGDPANTNLPFYSQLYSGAPPSWLQPIHVSRDVALYAVEYDLSSHPPIDESSP